MKKTLSIVLLVLLVFLAVACNPETHVHKYVEDVSERTDATCTTDGSKYMVCSCGSIVIVPVQALGHTNELLEAECTKGTCQEAGVDVYKCTVCGVKTWKTTGKDGSNHTKKSNETVIEKSTCIKNGKASYLCTDCNKTYEAELPLSKTHYYLDSTADEWKELTQTQYEYDTYLEANAFMGKVLKATCPTCGKDVLNNTKNILKDSAETADAAVESKILGNWFYTDKADEEDKDYTELYVTVVENKTANPSKYTVTTYLRVYEDGALATSLQDVVDGATYSGTGTMASPKTLTVTGAVDSKLLTLSCWDTADTEETLGNYTVKLDTYIASEAEINKLTTSGHTFKYQGEEKSVMNTFHYLTCTDEGCDLDFVEETHSSGCKVCGYTTDWKKIAIGVTKELSQINLMV